MPRSLSEIYFHIVFATKLRMPLITASLKDPLHHFLGGIVHNRGGSVLAIGGMPDHAHLLVRWGTSKPVAHLVKWLKGSSARWVNERRSEEAHSAWQEGYAVFSVSPSQVTKVRRYIENQEHHHRDLSFNSELTQLVRKSLPQESSRKPQEPMQASRRDETT